MECPKPALDLLFLGWEKVEAQTDLAEQQGGEQDPCEHENRTRMHLVVPSLFLLFSFALLVDLGQYFYLCFPLYLFICLFVLFFISFFFF